MERLDTHIHIRDNRVDLGELRANFDKAGLKGGALYSAKPIENGGTISFEERLDTLLKWTEGNDWLYPIFYIHPNEDGAIEKAQIAAERGVVGFKMICNNYSVGDKKPMKLLETIASLNKPVVFHSGILWDGQVTLEHNRPGAFEPLLEVPNLKFALAHMSWPWYDECIALYGELINAYLSKSTSSEMFIDLTPGTPLIYRKDALTKLFKIGYDVENNVLWGTDCDATNYNYNWTNSWFKTDMKIFKKLRLSKQTLDKIFGKNFLRFIGKEGTDVKHKVMLPDGRYVEADR